MARLLILGAGGYARAVAEAVSLAGQHTVIGFVDDRFPDLGPVWRLPVIGNLSDLASRSGQWAEVVVPALGDAQARERAVEAALAGGVSLVTVIHPCAIVSPSAHIEAGATVMAGAIIGTEARVGRCAIINAGAVLDHHAQVDAYAHVGVGARMGGGARLGARATLPISGVLSAGQLMQAPNS